MNILEQNIIKELKLLNINFINNLKWTEFRDKKKCLSASIFFYLFKKFNTEILEYMHIFNIKDETLIKFSKKNNIFTPLLIDNKYIFKKFLSEELEIHVLKELIKENPNEQLFVLEKYLNINKSKYTDSIFRFKYNLNLKNFILKNFPNYNNELRDFINLDSNPNYINQVQSIVVQIDYNSLLINNDLNPIDISYSGASEHLFQYLNLALNFWTKNKSILGITDFNHLQINNSENKEGFKTFIILKKEDSLLEDSHVHNFIKLFIKEILSKSYILSSNYHNNEENKDLIKKICEKIDIELNINNLNLSLKKGNKKI